LKVTDHLGGCGSVRGGSDNTTPRGEASCGDWLVGFDVVEIDVVDRVRRGEIDLRGNGGGERSNADGTLSKETSTFVTPEFGDETIGSNCPIFFLSLSDDGD